MSLKNQCMNLLFLCQKNEKDLQLEKATDLANYLPENQSSRTQKFHADLLAAWNKWKTQQAPDCVLQSDAAAEKAASCLGWITDVSSTVNQQVRASTYSLIPLRDKSTEDETETRLTEVRIYA